MGVMTLASLWAVKGTRCVKTCESPHRVRSGLHGALPPAMPVPALGPEWLRGHFLPCSSEWECHPFPVPC